MYFNEILTIIGTCIKYLKNKKRNIFRLSLKFTFGSYLCSVLVLFFLFCFLNSFNSFYSLFIDFEDNISDVTVAEHGSWNVVDVVCCGCS